MIVFPIRPKIQNEESFSSYLMRICIINRTTINEVIKDIIKNKHLARHYWLMDLDVADFANIDILIKFLKIGISDIKQCTFSIIKEKFLKTDELEKNRFVHGLIENKYRKFCPICIKKSNVFKLIWQVKDVEICDIHLIPLYNLCLICERKLPYIHEMIGLGKCPYCYNKLSDQQGFPYKLKINFEEQKYHYNNWRYLLQTDQEKNKEFPKGKELAQLLLYISQDKQHVFKRNSIAILQSDYISELLKYIKEGELEDNKVTLFFILRVIKSKKLPIKDFLEVSPPTTFILSIHSENQIQGCLSPWCSSYQSILRLKMVRRIRVREVWYRRVHVCFGCGLMFGFNEIAKWTYVENNFSYSILEKTREAINAGKTRNYFETRSIIGRHEINKIFAYLLRNNLLNEDIELKIKNNFIEENSISNFKVLMKMTGDRYQNARSLYKWSRLEYFYYYFDPQVQLLLFSNENQTKNVKLSLTPERKFTANVLGEDIDIIWMKSKNYVIDHSARQINLTKTSFYEYLGKARSWMKNNAPEVMEWFYIQQEIVEKQNIMLTNLQLKDKVIRLLIEKYKLGISITLTELIKEAGTTWYYLEVHELKSQIKLLIDSLLNGVYTVTWLEDAVKRVGTDNRLLQLIDEKLLKTHHSN